MGIEASVTHTVPSHPPVMAKQAMSLPHGSERKERGPERQGLAEKEGEAGFKTP